MMLQRKAHTFATLTSNKQLCLLDMHLGFDKLCGFVIVKHHHMDWVLNYLHVHVKRLVRGGSNT